MKSSSFKFLLFSLFFATGSIGAIAQDDDGIYGDIYQAPKIEEELLDTSVSPLDGYSTADDYYPEGGYRSEEGTNQPYSESYVDENGNNITNNYYGDYYEDDNDYDYASRINRFHRPMYNYGYYDPYYTNMYYYTYDPYYWGTSIYIGYRPNYYWGYSGWGWNYGWGWNGSYGYMPACYGGGYGYGWGGGGYWNGYNNGYWNGYHDGLAVGGYYNTYDPYSGIYYGHRGSTQNDGNTLGTGYRGSSFASAYNKAAKEGKVMHANVGNALQTADARPIKGNVDGIKERSTSFKADGLRETAPQFDRSASTDRVKVPAAGTESTRTTAVNPYQRGTSERASSTPQRSESPSVDRSRYRATTTQPRTGQDNNVSRSNTYQRGNETSRYSNTPGATQPGRSVYDQNRGNVNGSQQRIQPNTNGNSNDYYRSQPSRSGSDPRNGSQYARPSNDQRNGNYVAPSRGNAQPSRNATPSRNYQQPSKGSAPASSPQPSRNSSPAPSNDRGSSGKSFSAPSGSSGSSAPSRSSGSPSRGGRP